MLNWRIDTTLNIVVFDVFCMYYGVYVIIP